MCRNRTPTIAVFVLVSLETKVRKVRLKRKHTHTPFQRGRRGRLVEPKFGLLDKRFFSAAPMFHLRGTPSMGQLLGISATLAESGARVGSPLKHQDSSFCQFAQYPVWCSLSSGHEPGRFLRRQFSRGLTLAEPQSQQLLLFAPWKIAAEVSGGDFRMSQTRSHEKPRRVSVSRETKAWGLGGWAQK